jgi:hypothetical protein
LAARAEQTIPSFSIRALRPLLPYAAFATMNPRKRSF